MHRIRIHWITILSNTTGGVLQAVVQTVCECKNLKFLNAGCDKTKPRTNEGVIFWACAMDVMSHHGWRVEGRAHELENPLWKLE